MIKVKNEDSASFKSIESYFEQRIRDRRKKSLLSGDLSVLDVWTDKKCIIDEVSSYDVDQKIKECDLGLFDKRISGKELIEMKGGRKLTLIQKARAAFLDYMAANDAPPTREQMREFITPDFEKAVMIALNKKQSNESVMEVSLKLEEAWFAVAVKEIVTNIPVHLKNWVTIDEMKDKCMKLIEMFRSGEYEKLRDPMISKLKDLMKSLIASGRLKILVGRPGTGKSTEAGKIASKFLKPAIVSLSNTICNMFEHKCHGIAKYSCTKARYCFKHGKHDCIVFDESSQFGYETLDLLIEIFEKNQNAMFVIMGDVDQIPTFLSSGSFLYSAMKEFPECVTELNKQYRFQNNPEYRDLMSSVVNSEIPDGVQIECFTEELIRNTDCFITGANETVSWLNKVCLKVKNPELNVNSTYVKDSVDIAYALCTAKNPSAIPLIANSTKELKSKGDDYKLYVNTRFSFSHMSGDRFVLRNLVDETTVRVSDRQLNSFFSLGYAITVNKSQGLEWPSVCVYVSPRDRNLKNFNAMYVAISRGMDAMILATDENKSFTKTDLINILHKRYKFENFFELV